ncbi:uncharacterized protein A4U43_C01F13200 [Asparagus officinalis]|uniref:Uncharacterized protein n=1 Tax=Asparagus officinalis TaxID=4686 RepID=A0A5P1FRJ2_ASPOF|nr:uncharacterized protein A4U43_C01F13200 [Asparagus officinalis]
MAPKIAINKGKGKKVAGPSDDSTASSAFSEWENELKSVKEMRQTLATQQAEHQTLLQIESDDLERLSNIVSNVKVSSDNDLRKQAMAKVEMAYQESIGHLA